MGGGEISSGAPYAAWWKTFHDPELNTLVDRVVDSNLTLRIAEARVRESRALGEFATAGEGPQLTAITSYSRNRYHKNGFPPLPPTISPDYNLYHAGFDASWELDLFGGLRREVQAANAKISAAEYARDDVLRSLLSEVARNYIQARAYQQQLVIAKENIRAQRRVVKLTRNRYKAGLTTELDMQQAAALLATTESRVPILEAGFRNATYSLDVLLGHEPGKLLKELSGRLPIPRPPPRVPVGLPSDLLLRRPDVRHAERELAASTALIGVAKSDYFPKFSLTGIVGVDSISVGNWWTAGSRFWSAGPVFTWRIFDSGRIRANIHAQNARQEQALAQYEETVLTSFKDVESALTSYANEQIRHQSLQQAVQADQRALNIADDLYRHGLVDFIRVLDSQRALYKAQDTIVACDRDVALDLVALYKALGGGWQVAARSKPEVRSSMSHNALKINRVVAY